MLFSYSMSRLGNVSRFGVVALFVLSGCTTGAGDGRVWGELYLPECGIETDNFDMNVDFFAADYFDNTLTIRMQTNGQIATFVDGVHLLIRDVRAMSDSAEGTVHNVTVEPSLEEFRESGDRESPPKTTFDSPAQVTLYLNDTCPGNRLAFTDGAGTLEMESIYEPGVERRIRGVFHLAFVDGRHRQSPDDASPHAEIQGEFDFNYTRGKPSQPFP